MLNSPTFNQMIERFRMVCSGFADVTIIVAPGGLGKSTSAIMQAEAHSLDFGYLSCKVTPYELYRKLYELRQKDLIILDDIEEIFKNNINIGLMKGVFWPVNGKRIAQYNSSVLKDLPKEFEIEARFICLANEIPKNKKMDALVNRTKFLELKISHAELMELMEQKSKEPYEDLNQAQRTECLEFIRRNSNEATSDLSLRTLLHTYDYYRYTKDWKTMALAHLKVDDCRKEIMIEVMKKFKVVKEQEAEFIKRAKEKGMKASHATFFRLAKNIGDAK